MKFARRTDLSPEVRARIALQAYANRGVWGSKTQLARRYGVSRQFIYLLLWSVSHLFEAEAPVPSESQTTFEVSPEELLVALKLEGRCSIGSISRILKTLGLPNNSVGYVSQQLHRLAAALPNETPNGPAVIVVLADETFAAGCPILVVIEARSHCILRAVLSPDRKGETWRKLFENLQAQGHVIDYVVADLGSGLLSGADLAELAHHPDLMHLIRPLGAFLSRFQKKAEMAIAHEYDRKRVFENARSEQTLQKYLDQVEQASLEAAQAIRRYDDYAYLWAELLRALDPFDSQGALRPRTLVEGEVQAILALMEAELEVPKLHAAVKTFREAVQGYWAYFDRMESIVNELSKHLPQDVLRELCLAWQLEKKSRAAKDYETKMARERKAEEHRFLASCGDVRDPDSAARLVFDRLEDNVRSSSPLESINSLIRDYLNNCRGQITQEMLDLLVYFLNHKIASRGPYEGTSAWQRLTGEPEQGTYLDQLLEYLKRVG